MIALLLLTATLFVIWAAIIEDLRGALAKSKRKDIIWLAVIEYALVWVFIIVKQ